MYKVIIFLFMPMLLLAYSDSDSDMDGVDDKSDQCPNTSLTELVDLRGCTIKNLLSPHHFDIILGQSYVEDDDIRLNLSQLQMGYYYKNFSLQLSGSYFDVRGDTLQDSGLNDVYLNSYYQIRPTSNLLIRFGGGVAFPTYERSSNKTDYRASLQTTYTQNDFSLFGELGYTVVGDNDSNSSSTLEYNNTYFYKIGLGYYVNNNFYSSLAYTHFRSTAEQDIETVSLYGYYMLTNNWFTTINYSYGLSDNAMDSVVGLKLGYYW